MPLIQKKWKIILDKTSVISLLPAGGVSKSGPASDLNVIEVSTATDHNLVLLSDGTVMAMGSNQHGQLGNATRTMGKAACKVVTNEEGEILSNIKTISAGGFHNIALDQAGQVWTWGRNREGQLGIGLTNGVECVRAATRVVFPQEVNIVAISAGATFSLALDEAGYVWAWGDNEEGQLGIGFDRMGQLQFQPIQVTTEDGHLNHIQSISAGQYHSLALDKDGLIWGWGANWNGALGFDKNMNFSRLEEEIMLSWGQEIIFNSESVVYTSHLYTWMDYMAEYYPHEMIWDCAKRVSNSQHVFTEIVAGNMQSQAMKRDGSIWVWGYVEDPTSDEGRYFNGERLGSLNDYLVDANITGSELQSTIPSHGSRWIWTICEDNIPLPAQKMIDMQGFTAISDLQLFMICRSSYVTEWILEDTYINYDALII